MSLAAAEVSERESIGRLSLPVAPDAEPGLQREKKVWRMRLE